MINILNNKNEEISDSIGDDRDIGNNVIIGK